ncbi:hypothetical protein ACFSWE_03535 [Leucobacter albus]|uniref:Excreted virulence factor EspC (Type VII ESX diderm) n=1 Tax=Leucobacter albus TaxID=272210 RepID=A0ABW3TN74_9MICO
MEWLALDLEMLEDQARRLGQLATEVLSAAEMATDAESIGLAFGNMGRFVIADISVVAATVSTAAYSAQEALTGTAQQLRSVVRETQAIEEEIAHTLRSLELEIED